MTLNLAANFCYNSIITVVFGDIVRLNTGYKYVS